MKKSASLGAPVACSGRNANAARTLLGMECSMPAGAFAGAGAGARAVVMAEFPISLIALRTMRLSARAAKYSFTQRGPPYVVLRTGLLEQRHAAACGRGARRP